MGREICNLQNDRPSEALAIVNGCFPDWDDEAVEVAHKADPSGGPFWGRP